MTTTCDRAGCGNTAERHWISIDRIDSVDGQPRLERPLELDVDLCEQCLADMVESIREALPAPANANG